MSLSKTVASLLLKCSLYLSDGLNNNKKYICKDLLLVFFLYWQIAYGNPFYGQTYMVWCFSGLRWIQLMIWPNIPELGISDCLFGCSVNCMNSIFIMVLVYCLHGKNLHCTSQRSILLIMYLWKIVAYCCNILSIRWHSNSSTAIWMCFKYCLNWNSIQSNINMIWLIEGRIKISALKTNVSFPSRFNTLHISEVNVRKTTVNCHQFDPQTSLLEMHELSWSWFNLTNCFVFSFQRFNN